MVAVKVNRLTKRSNTSPEWILFTLLKSKGSELGWYRPVLISEAAELLGGETDEIVESASSALRALMLAKIVIPTGFKQRDLVRLADTSLVSKV